MEEFLEKLKSIRNSYVVIQGQYVVSIYQLDELIQEIETAQQQVKVEPKVKVQIAEKIKEVIQEKKNNIEEAIRNDDRYMKQCFDSELEAVEDLLERLQASNLSA